MLASPFAARLAGIPVREREARIAGVATRWWEYGDVDAAAIVAVHGFRGDHHGLEPFVALLDAYRVIAPDLPGFGESRAFPGATTIDAYADWLTAFVAAVAPGTAPTVLGHSFGTIVTARAVARGLDAGSVVLVNPIAAAADQGPSAAGTFVARAWYRIAAALGDRAGRTVLEARPFVDLMSLLTTTTSDRRLRRWIRQEHRRYFSTFASTASVIAGFDASLADHVGHHAEAFTMPTLLVAAAADQIVAVEDVVALAARMPDARLVVLDGVGHLIHYERPEEAAAAIGEFLADT